MLETQKIQDRKLKLILSILLSLPFYLSGQEILPDTIRIASIEQHPAMELFPCKNRNCYVGLRISANSKISRQYLRCELCKKFFLVGQELSFIVAYSNGREVAAQFAHHDCIQEYNFKKLIINPIQKE